MLSCVPTHYEVSVLSSPFLTLQDIFGPIPHPPHSLSSHFQDLIGPAFCARDARAGVWCRARGAAVAASGGAAPPVLMMITRAGVWCRARGAAAAASGR